MIRPSRTTTHQLTVALIVAAIAVAVPSPAHGEAVPASHSVHIHAAATKSIHFMHARYYSPNLGRFLSVDPVGGTVGSSQSWNRYTYVRNNPVRLTDPTGMYVGLDDLAFTVVGAAVGLAGQGVSDLISGDLSGWEDYAAAAVGGAAGGEALLYTGPIGAGAIGGATTNLTRQGLKNWTGNQDGFDGLSLATDTSVGAATGLVPGLKIQGITAGRGSANQVFKQITTKAQNGTISNIKGTTALKMVLGRTTDTALVPGAGAAAVAAGSGFLPSSEARKPPSEIGIDAAVSSSGKRVPAPPTNPYQIDLFLSH